MIRYGSMSDRTDPRAPSGRRGVALLLTIVIAVVVGMCTLALWRASAAATRTFTLEAAGPRSDALADSALARATAEMAIGGWRILGRPGEMRVIASGTSRLTRWHADVGRVTWSALVIRGVGVVRSGARGVSAHADVRRIVPLVAPMPVPDAALIGVAWWSIDAGASVEVPVASGAEVACRSSGGVVASARHPFPVAVDSLRLPLIDPDTVRDPLVGAFRLTRGRITRPLRVVGIVAVDTELVVEADLRVTGVLVARGSVHTAGGRLDVTGAVVTGDMGGGPSGLGAGDRVRYDACAIRRAVERVTSPGPTSTWTILPVF